MMKFKIDEAISSSGKSIVYHRTVKERTIETLQSDLDKYNTGIVIDKNLSQADANKIISGNLPINYNLSRTLNDIKETISGIDRTGINANPGVYGPPGVYNTYELSSQFSGQMYHYGCAIVKSFLKLNHVLILDAAYAQKVYGTLAKPSDQLKYFKAKLSGNSVKLADEAYSLSDKSPNFLTSVNAKNITNSKDFKDALDKGTIKGIVFTGSNDGQVLVAYDHDILIPISWCFAKDREQASIWFKFSSTGGRNLRKIAAGKMKYEYDFNDTIFTRAKWFLAVLKANDYKSIIEAFEQKYVFPLMMVDGDFLIFKFVQIKNLELIDKLFETSQNAGAPVLNTKSKITKSTLLFESVRKNNFVLANYMVDNFKIVDINTKDLSGAKIIDVIRTKSVITDPDEISFWNKLVNKKHYLDAEELRGILSNMGILKENYSRVLNIYKTIY